MSNDTEVFNSAVQDHIDARAKEGVTLSWDDAAKQVGNLLKNVGEDPEATEAKFAVENRLKDLEARVAALEGGQPTV